MQQVLQHLGTGRFELVEVPCPAVRPGHLLIESRTSLISAGTERMLLEFGRANWLERARQQPDRVRQVLEKVSADGPWAAWEAVRAKLDREIPLGYANCGRVVSAGAGVRGWREGDRVLSNGPHAEMVAVPANLCVRVPAGITDDHAPFGVLAAIALQGLRLAAPTLGESFVVTGLGLVGLLATQLLRANGCRVLGIDPDAARLDLAARWGVTPCPLVAGSDPVARVMEWTRGRGADGVLIAAATRSSEPVRQAAAMSRRRGRIVLTGVAGLELSRDLFYKKELSFQVSCSYGPGRHDPAYERDGRDYPFGEVRWTAQRNMEAALDTMSAGQLDVAGMISHRFAYGAIEEAYRVLLSGEPALGMLLTYPARTAEKHSPVAVSVPIQRARSVEPLAAAPGVSVIGAGEFATRFLIPELRRAGARLNVVVSENGVNAAAAARRFGFARAASAAAAAWNDPDGGAVVIATRHDSHALLAREALEAGRAVWVEKPLAATEAELLEIGRVCARRLEAGDRVCLMVGFNRRFSPWTTRLRRSLAEAGGPFEFRYLVNAGRLEDGHWALDARQGGGRILGECCHFIDLLRHLCGQRIAKLEARSSAGQGARLWLEFEDGSSGSIDYLVSGSRAYPKERLEVFGGGRTWLLDNFQQLRVFPGQGGPGGAWWAKLRAPQKGHPEAMRAFLAAAAGTTPSPIPLDEILEVSQWSLIASELAR